MTQFQNTATACTDTTEMSRQSPPSFPGLRLCMSWVFPGHGTIRRVYKQITYTCSYPCIHVCGGQRTTLLMCLHTSYFADWFVFFSYCSEINQGDELAGQGAPGSCLPWLLQLGLQWCATKLLVFYLGFGGQRQVSKHTVVCSIF